MAGIYIHIPFCKTICPYCDFYKIHKRDDVDAYLACLLKELEQNKSYLSDKVVSIYFGGGTPSMIQSDKIGEIILTISSLFSTQLQEVTVECNPDDVTLEYLNKLMDTGVNRISLGVQTLSDRLLKVLGRRHTSQKAIQAIEDIQNSTIDNFSIDLMYGLPHQTIGDWERDLAAVLSFDVPHISAYHLTYHSNTPFGRKQKKGILQKPLEEESVLYYQRMRGQLIANGYEHYEISNFAKKQKYALHNSLYWGNKPYLGIGASAHSYSGKSRKWNCSDIKQYMLLTDYYTEEILTEEEKYNDMVITGLRTKLGIKVQEINQFNSKISQHFFTIKQKYISQQLAIEKEGFLSLTPDKGWLLSDTICTDFLFV